MGKERQFKDAPDRKKGFLVILLLLIAAAIIAFLALSEEKPVDDRETIAAGAEFDVESDYFPESPLTAIYLYQNLLLFAEKGHEVLYANLFVFSQTDEECELYAGNTVFYCNFNMQNNTFDLFFIEIPEDYYDYIDDLDDLEDWEDFEYWEDDWDLDEDWDEDEFLEMFELKHYGSYSFTPGQVSDKAIEFPLGIKYRYFVSSDKKRIFLLLDSQEFELQFGKKLWFKGMDTGLDKRVDQPFFAPAVEDFPQVKEDSVAVFEVDSDEDGAADIKFFVDAFNVHLAEPGNEYPWQAVFWKSPYWRGMNADSAKKMPNGTAVFAELARLVIRMPHSDSGPISE